MTTEIWKPIPSRPGFQASSLGRIKGLSGRIMSQCLTHNGYLYVNSQPVTTVNRLVCEAFHGTPPTSLHQAAHGNGIRTDNIPENLRWVTRPENYQDQIGHGTHRKGARHHMAKLSNDDVAEIRRLRGKEKQTSIAARYGIRDSAVSRIQTGKRWAHL